MLADIPGTGGLSYVTNTDSALLKLGETWYYLVAGRWFSTANPFMGPWTFVEALPEAFAAIPADHTLAYVRVAVRGTVEAKVAALESLLPKQKTVAMNAQPAITVSYAGEPKFEPIESTPVMRGVNTGYDVILFENTYYLLYAGVWYSAVAPVGPWAVAMNVPPEIYSIPPSSPSYHVTQVTVVETTKTEVVYEQTPAYSSSVYVVYGVPWYGTGYYYYPYVVRPLLLPVPDRLRPRQLLQPGDRRLRFALGVGRPLWWLLLQPGLQPAHRPLWLRRDRLGRRRVGEPRRDLQPAHRRRDRDRPLLQRGFQPQRDGTHGRARRRVGPDGA